MQRFQTMEPVMSKPQLYGGFGGFARSEKDKLFYARGQRQRMNVVSVCQCLFVPWLMFCFTYGVTSFSIRYTNPTLMYAMLAASFILVLATAGLALGVLMKKFHHEFHEPNWFIFLFLTCAIGWCVGICFGNVNYATNMQPYYDYTGLNEYYYVDPARMRGAQLMDAGRVHFTNNTALDLRISMGFRDLDTYCVAPITVDGLPLSSYDFWAVGLDCCSGNAADFHCGEYNNPKAKSGLRVLRDEQRPFFRLAVQQAEAVHNIRAVHPLFFYWGADSSGDMDYFKEEGYRWYLIGMLAHFMWQLLCVGLAVSGFSKFANL